ncbi:hypothetical protein GCM10009608_08980 [Pseudonocardia alaniniphila]
MLVARRLIRARFMISVSGPAAAFRAVPWPQSMIMRLRGLVPGAAGHPDAPIRRRWLGLVAWSLHGNR